jgi:hypothetical protein
VSIGDGLDISLSSDVDVEIPARGIFGASAQDGATLGPFVTSEKISSIVACDIVEILDAPPVYFSGGTTFYSVRDGPVNERSAWSNGKNFLFYIPAHKSFNPTAFGKWLVGPELGVDSAIAYIEPNFDTLSPLFSADSNASGSEWHTISSGSWVTGPIYTACAGTAVRASYYVASYLDRSRQEQRDTIVLGHIDSKDAVAFSKGTYGPYWNSIVKPNMNSFWDSDTKRWLVLTNVRDAIAYGEPMLLVASSPTEEGCIGNLINLEFLYSRFRLMFRCTNVDKEVFSFLGGPGPTATDPEYDRLVADNVEPIHINKHEAEGQFARSLAFIEQAEVDEFLWLWYREENSDNTHGHGSTDESESDLSSHVRLTTDELLVQCVGKSEGRLVLQYYPSDRREILRRSLLSHFTSVIMVDTSGTTPVISLDGKEMDIVSVTSLGLDIEGYLRGYLIRHEGRFGGLSSCYLYHAAIAMPKPLVYAAEVYFLLAPLLFSLSLSLSLLGYAFCCLQGSL